MGKCAKIRTKRTTSRQNTKLCIRYTPYRLHTQGAAGDTHVYAIEVAVGDTHVHVIEVAVGDTHVCSAEVAAPEAGGQCYVSVPDCSLTVTKHLKPVGGVMFQFLTAVSR